MSVVCVLLPRFELAVAAGGHATLLRQPAALAPVPGGSGGGWQGRRGWDSARHGPPPRTQPGASAVGEVSAAAEAFGIRQGMALGEALARCPGLALVPPDPAGVAEAWEGILGRLEGVGALVAPERPGLACFAAGGLRRLHGGGLEGVLAAVRRALGRPARLGAGPTAFCALAAAVRARVVRPEVVRGGEAEARAYLAPLSVRLLALRARTAALPAPLEQLGVRTLGELAALPRDGLADRFGAPGVHAHRLACGRDAPLTPRRPPERLRESLELPEAASGPALEHALGLLVDRMVARRERRGRTLRSVALSATLVEGGTWRERVTFREPLADPERMRLALALRLGLLPAPAEALRLEVESFGPPVTDQRPLLDEDAATRDARLREAVGQTRALAGVDAALRVVDVQADSRVPERRAMLAPFEGAE